MSGRDSESTFVASNPTSLVVRLREARAALDHTGITQFDNTLNGGSLYLKAADEIDDARRTADYWKAEHTAANDVIAEVREILGEFDSEDVQVMARRAIDRIRELESSSRETECDVCGATEGRHWDDCILVSPRPSSSAVPQYPHEPGCVSARDMPLGLYGCTCRALKSGDDSNG